MGNTAIVLYKKTGEKTTLKQITDLWQIKKLICKGVLEMVRFENCIIVCNNSKSTVNQIPNIVLDLRHIAGDFFLIGYNPKKKDFRSLNNKEIQFYKDILDRKSFQYDHYKKWTKTIKNEVNNVDNTLFPIKKEFQEIVELDRENSSKNSNHSKDILNMILNIQSIILKYIGDIDNQN